MVKESYACRRVRWSCMNRILIIGATGRTGRQILSQLPATGVRVRALARNPHTAGLPPHVDVVRGDLPGVMPTKVQLH